MPPTDRRFVRYVLLMAALFLAVRVVYFRQLLDSPVFTFPILDSEFYHQWATSLALGHGHPPGPFWLSPLYPIFLAGLFKASGSTAPSLVAVIQFLMSLGTLALIVLYTRRLFEPAVAVLTALLAALCAPWVFYDGVMLSASLILFLNALILLMLVLHGGFGSSASGETAPGHPFIWVAIGLACGLSALARPSILIFALPLVLWLGISRHPGRWLRAGLFLVSIIVVLLPALVRNVKVSGSLLLTTSSGGVNFFVGNRAGASGRYDELNFVPSFDPDREAEGYRAEASRRTGRKLSLDAASRYWAGQALEDIITEPGSWVRLLIKKLWLTMQREELGTNISFRGMTGFAPILRVLPLRWALLFPLAVTGAFLAWRRRPELRLLWLYGGAYLAVNLIFFSASEYRFPLLLVLLPAAACFWVELWNAVVAKNTRRLIITGVVYLLALVVCNFPSRQVTRATRPRSDYYDMAVGAWNRGLFMDAVPLYARSLTVDPSFQEARVGLARCLWKLGNFDDARNEFALAGVPAPDTLSGAPMQSFLDELYLYTEADDYPGALEFINTTFPPDKEAPKEIWINRAMVESELGKYDDAIASLLRAETQDPGSPEFRYKAGLLALAAHDTARADTFLNQSLELYPAYAPARITLADIALARQDTLSAKAQLYQLRMIRIPDRSTQQQVWRLAVLLHEEYDVSTPEPPKVSTQE
jgi:tetratricopeptide (TPR) repeat protein